MYWTLFKLFVAVVFPIPVNPRVIKASTPPNTWICSCDSFTTLYAKATVFWNNRVMKSPFTVSPVPRPPTRRQSVRPSDHPLTREHIEKIIAANTTN